MREALIAPRIAAFFGLVYFSLNSANGASAYEDGLKLQRERKWAAAAAAFSKAIEADPKNAAAYRKHGAALVQMGKFDESLADANRAIALAPRSANAYALRGYIEMRLHKFKQALKDADQCLDIDSQLGDGYALKGMVLVKMERYEEALPNLNQAISHGFKETEVFGFRALAYIAKAITTARLTISPNLSARLTAKMLSVRLATAGSPSSA